MINNTSECDFKEENVTSKELKVINKLYFYIVQYRMLLMYIFNYQNMVRLCLLFFLEYQGVNYTLENFY